MSKMFHRSSRCLIVAVALVTLAASSAAAHSGQGNATPSNIGSGHAWGHGDYCTLSPDAIPLVFNFHHACIHHDGCYAGFPNKPAGFGAYWVSRAQCDSWFLGDMDATCREMHPSIFDRLRADCFNDATVYFAAVRALGWKFYAQKGIVFLEPGAPRPQIYPLLEKLPPGRDHTFPYADGLLTLGAQTVRHDSKRTIPLRLLQR